MRFYFLLLLSLLYFSPSGHTQPASHFTVQFYTTENGLPSNGIKGLQWDEKTGFLWMATEAGIARFNGINFKIFNKENSDVIKAERMQYLIRNLRGDIYANDQVGTIIRINKHKLSFRKKLDPESRLLGFTTYGLTVSDTFFNYRLDHPGKVSFAIRFQKLIPLTDTSLIAIKNNTVFYNTLTDTDPVLIKLNGLRINEGFVINKNCFLVSDKKDIFLFNESTKSISPVSVNAPASVIAKIKNTKTVLLWDTGLDNPILIFEKTAWQLLFDGTNITAEEICNSIPTGILFQYAQYSKEKKILFLGTDSKGLIIISANKVQPVKNRNPEGNERNAYYSQIELPDGNVLTNEGHIIGTKPISKEALPLKGKFGFNISRTGDSLLWYSQYETDARFNTLHRYNFKTGITKNYSKISAANHFVISLQNNKTIVLNEKGIGELQEDTIHYICLFRGNKIKNAPGDIIEAEPGVVVVAIRDAILKFNTSTLKLDTLIHEENLYARTLFRYNEYLFAGTYGKGFYLIKNGKAKPMPLDKNKYLLYTHCFMPDNRGFCWISTNRGAV